MLFGLIILLIIILSLIGIYTFIIIDTRKQRRILKQRKIWLNTVKSYKRKILGQKKR